MGDGVDGGEHLFDRLEPRVHQFGLAQAAHPRRGVLQAEHDRTADLALAAGQFGVGQAALHHPGDLLGADGEHLVRLGRQDSDVDAPHAGVGVLRGEAVHRVGQAALLPDLLEQPGGHAAAERRVQHAEREPAVVGPGQGLAAEHQVGLLDAAGDQRGPRAGLGTETRVAAVQPGRGGLGLVIQDRLERAGDEPHHHVVVHVAGRGHHQVLRGVPGLVVLEDLLPGDRVDRVHGAEDRTAERGVAEQLRGERLVNGVRGVVIVHRDLFEHHVALGVHILRRDQRTGHHVGQHVHGQRQVRVEHPGVVAGVLLRGERVHLAADRVHLRGEFQRGTPLGALEQQVLQVVRRAGVRVVLVPGPDADPDAQRHRAHGGQVLGNDPEPAGQDGAADPMVSFGFHLFLFVMPAGTVPGAAMTVT